MIYDCIEERREEGFPLMLSQFARPFASNMDEGHIDEKQKKKNKNRILCATHPDRCRRHRRKLRPPFFLGI